MKRNPWRALLRKSACLMLAVCTTGCLGTAEVVKSPAVSTAPPSEISDPTPPEETLPLADTGPTVLERLSQTHAMLEAERQRTADLTSQLEAEKARSADLENQLAGRMAAADKLRRQLDDMEQAIKDVRNEAAAAEAIRPQVLVLQAQLDAAREELKSRKQEMLQLTSRLEDIYNVLIKEFEARAQARDLGEVVVRPE